MQKQDDWTETIYCTRFFIIVVSVLSDIKWIDTTKNQRSGFFYNCIKTVLKNHLRDDWIKQNDWIVITLFSGSHFYKNGGSVEWKNRRLRKRIWTAWVVLGIQKTD